MLLFITWNLVLFHLMLNFNTSHVTVYPIIQTVVPGCTIISIHLMLLFISGQQIEGGFFSHFNTSHVTVYQVQMEQNPRSSRISIHLMLLFIDNLVSVAVYAD